MFGIGPMELVIIALVAIVFVGPKRLPEAMRKMGKTFVQIRRQTQDIRNTFNDVVRDAERDLELDRIRELKERMEKLNPKEMLKSAIEDKSDPDYHESHYVDGEYKNADDGYLDASLLEDNGWKHLKPKKDEVEAAENPDGSSASTDESPEKLQKPDATSAEPQPIEEPKKP